MSVIFIVVPLAALLVLAAVIAFVASARRGQFDDLDTPPVRMLNDEFRSSSESRSRKSAAKD
jgi:cbb3-type cytochrome oxidase maturation protein